LYNQERRDYQPQPEITLPPPPPESKTSVPVPKPAAKPKPAPRPKSTPAAKMVMPAARHQLPPLELLVKPAADPTRGANARYQAQIIEDTLRGFGIPAEVVEINSGPTVTQFGLKLGTVQRKLADGSIVDQRIRVNKVAALNNDLALALSAAPIRIETPVPGRPLVGIEVPNGDKTLVSLRGVMEDRSFQQNKKPLLVALGKDVSGQAISASLTEMPHLLIAGATGSGKSVCVNAIISTLLMGHSPEQLRFLMIDPKMVELTGFNGIPHLVAPVVTDFEQVVGALAWVTREMDRRYKLFSKAGARSLGGYNKKIGNKAERLPYLIVIIDELADLMMMAPDEVERSVARIAQMARATGIHLIIATQRPSVDVVTGLIKANFPTRIAFAVTSQIDSRVILDTPGAEKLLGKGDMLYMAADSPMLARLQGCFVSDEEIQNLVRFWQLSVPTSGTVSDSTEEDESDKLPWDDILADAEKDDMLEDAVKLVVESGRASTSMLQRRLGIGYPRAARLMDQLEEEGVIGPANGAKPRDVLWNEDGDEDDYAEFEQDIATDQL
jgi:S-DNA-T family DNA segregation ATPase FtsK/SpoIIIE